MPGEKEIKEISISEKITYSTVLVKSVSVDSKISTGTGFVLNLNEVDNKCVPVVVTNKHVIDGALYTELSFCKANIDGTPNDKEIITFRTLKKMWIEHPSVDLCCCTIGTFINKQSIGNKPFYIPLSINNIPSKETIEDFAALEEVIMVGYPIGIADNYNNKPILRKGITATHIKNDYQGKHEFVVDMACFPGSSGSPIFILNEGSYSFKNEVYLGSRFYFVGILYGGPQYDARGVVSVVTSNIIADTLIPTNLGFAIKSDEVLEFDKMIKKHLAARK